MPSFCRAPRTRSAALLATSTLALLVPSLALASDDAAVADAAVVEDAEPTVSGVVVTGRPDTYQVERTTTATRTDTPLSEVPQSVTVVTEELIDDQAMQGVADVLQYVPGATMGQG